MEATNLEKTNGSASQVLTVKHLFAKEEVRKKFEELLGKRASGFITSVLQCVASNEMLKNADPATVYHAAAVAATLDLPLNNSLGMAYIVPYSNKGKVQAQFQMGYKSFIQLAQRTGQFLTINSTDVRQGEIKHRNRLTGDIEFEWDQTPERSAKAVVGYVAYFKLLNGFEKSLFMSTEELKAHGKRYSQTFKKDFGLWKDAFDAMASKTVIKLLLSKFAPLSIEMQKAVLADQAIINDAEATDVTYVDNEAESVVDKEAERLLHLLQDCTTHQEVDSIAAQCPQADAQIFIHRKAEISAMQTPDADQQNNALLAIEICSSLQELKLVEQSYAHLAQAPWFVSAFNSKKILIGKQLKKGVTL